MLYNAQGIYAGEPLVCSSGHESDALCNISNVLGIISIAQGMLYNAQSIYTGEP